VLNSKQNIPKQPRDLSSSNKGENVENEVLMSPNLRREFDVYVAVFRV